MRPVRPTSWSYALKYAGLAPFDVARVPARRVLMVGHNGIGNLGADLRTIAVRRLLPECDLDMITYDPNRTRDEFRGVEQHLLPVDGVGELWRLVSQCDAVVVTEGCALGPRGFWQFAGAMALAGRQGKTAVAYCVGADGMLPEHGRWLKHNCASAVFVARDTISERILRNLGLNVFPGTDPVWQVRPKNPRSSVGNDVLVCASNPFAWPEVCRHLYEQWQVQLIALTKAVGPERICFFAMEQDDNPIAQTLAQQTGASAIHVGDMDRAVNQFGKARAVLSARFHGVVLGKVFGACTLGVAVDERLIALARDRSDVVVVGVNDARLEAMIQTWIAQTGDGSSDPIVLPNDLLALAAERLRGALGLSGSTGMTV